MLNLLKRLRQGHMWNIIYSLSLRSSWIYTNSVTISELWNSSQMQGGILSSLERSF